MKTKLFLLMLFVCTMAKAQVTTEATVTNKIATFLPTNNARGISANGLRSTLNTMTDLISRKVNNEQIIVSQDEKSVKIKTTTPWTHEVKPPIELYHAFVSTVEKTYTGFLFKGKQVYHQEILALIPDEVGTIDGYDELVSMSVVLVYTDGQGVVHREQQIIECTVCWDKAAGTITANNWACSGCSNKQLEISIYYTKR